MDKITSDFQALKDITARFSVNNEYVETAVRGLRLHRCSGLTAPLHAAYGPTLNLVLQGAKKLRLGADEYHYGVGQYLLTSVDLPVTSWVVEASGDAPYLCLALELRLEAVRDFADWQSDDSPVPGFSAARALSVQDVPDGLGNALRRLMELLDTPEDIPTLRPLIEREILYRLLKGPDGQHLLDMAAIDSQSNKIALAVAWLRANFHKPLVLDVLLNHVGMSSSSFHRHFKAITALAPIDFQKRLRLQEARRLMVVEGLSAGDAGFRVGYQSQSQFGREYLRFYGTSPARDRRGVNPGVSERAFANAY